MAAIAFANLNSYVTVAEANAYFVASIRAASSWSAAPTTKKERALVTATRMFERQQWIGVKATGLVNVTEAVVAVGGTGYANGDLVEVVGGTGVVAIAKVTAHTLGVVTAVEIVDAGIYSVAPTNDAATTAQTGAGDDALTLTLTTAAQALDFPRTGLTDSDGVAISSTEVPQEIKDACCELAYELTRDADLETARDQNSNIASVSAGGGVGVTYFRPQDANGRFPPTVQELLGPFLGSTSALANAPAGALGSSCVDSFRRGKYGLTEGVP